MKECSRPGCTRPVHASGLCRKHWDHQRYLKRKKAGKLSTWKSGNNSREQLAGAIMLLVEAHKFVVYCQNHPNVVLDYRKVAALAERLDNFLRSKNDEVRT